MSTTNWWQQAKKSHSKLQTAARRSAPLAAANEEGSRFVECPACGASMHRQSLNHHLDLDCPVLHGYGDAARGSDASSTARSSIQSGPRESDAVALRRPSDASRSGQRGSDAAAPSRPSDASRYGACPVCSESVLLSDMNYHLELRCRGAAAEAPTATAPAMEEFVAADAIGACPLCDQKMPLVAIADHIDAGCPQIAAAAPSPPRESRVLEDLRAGAACPLCMDTMEDPHCLPCAHTFCKDCILRAFETTRPGHGHECPVCRAPCRKRSIQPAAQLRALVDIVRRAEAAAAPADAPGAGTDEASDAAGNDESEDEDEAEEEPVEAPPSPAPPASPPAAAPSPVAAAPSPVRSPEEEATLARVRGNLARALAAEPPAAASPVAAPSPSPPAESLLARRRASQGAPDEDASPPEAEPSPSPSPEPLARRRPRRAAAQSSDAALARRLQDSAYEAATRKKKRRR